eukprot:3938871-Rhodomonas_salina.2
MLKLPRLAGEVDSRDLVDECQTDTTPYMPTKRPTRQRNPARYFHPDPPSLIGRQAGVSPVFVCSPSVH